MLSLLSRFKPDMFRYSHDRFLSTNSGLVSEKSLNSGLVSEKWTQNLLYVFTLVRQTRSIMS